MRTTLHEIWTQDRIALAGLLFEPQRKSQGAIVFIHGLTSSFHASVKRINALADFATKNDISLAAFDNRGHDIFASATKIDRRRRKGYTHKNIGAGLEVFRESYFDIKAVVDFLRKNGYREIFLAGHSTGANKAVYYMSRSKGRGIAGVALLGSVSDVPGATSALGDKYTGLVKLAQKRVKAGKGNELMVHPAFDFPKTARRLLSLAVPGSREDVFQYHMGKPRYTAFKKIKKPLLIVFGKEEQHAAPYTVEQIIESYQQNTNSRNFSSAIIPNADHSFTDREKQLAQTLVSWVNSLIPR